MKLPFGGANEWPWRWMQTDTSAVLHRVVEFARRDRDYPGVVDGVAACGIKAKRFTMPGTFSRLGADRCRRCCKKLGIDHGRGAPYNSGIKEPSKLR